MSAPMEPVIKAGTPALNAAPRDRRDAALDYVEAALRQMCAAGTRGLSWADYHSVVSTLAADALATIATLRQTPQKSVDTETTSD